MRELAERVYVAACGLLGRLLRGARYSRVRIVRDGDAGEVRKRRAPYAPILVWLAGPMARVLDTGVRVLPQRAWEARERALYERLYGSTVRAQADGTLVLPWLPGETLATLLVDRALGEPHRHRAVGLAVEALAGLHRAGITHGDAMAENVLVDLDGGVARWFDFETLHEAHRSWSWRRADDLRALLTTCLVHTAPEERAGVRRLVLAAYADEAAHRQLAATLGALRRRSLAFHLGQASLSYADLRELARAVHRQPDR